SAPHLHGAQDGRVDLGAADHAEAGRGVPRKPCAPSGCWPDSVPATTSTSPKASAPTGSGTGTTETTPATPSPAGWKPEKTKYGCSRPCFPFPGPTIQPSKH